MRLLRYRRPALWRAFRVVAAIGAGRAPEPARPALDRLDRALALRLTRGERRVLLGALGWLRLSVAMAEEDVDLLVAAADPFRDAVELAPSDPEQAASVAMNHAVALSAIAAVTDAPETRESALRQARRARQLLPAGSPMTADLLDSLIEVLVSVYELTEDPGLLSEAAKAGREFAALNDGGWYPLAVALRLLFEHDGDDAAVLAEARECAERAASTLDEAENWAELAHILRLEHGESGAADTAAAAAAAARRAVDATGADDDDLAARRLLLAGTLLDCHQAGDGDALDEAVAVARAVLHRPDAEDDLTVCQTAAMVLGTFAMRHDDAGVLAEAEGAARGAVRAAENTADLGVALDALSSVQENLYVLTGDLDRLDEAIVTGEASVGQATAKAADQAGHVGNLATLLRTRYEATGRRDDLDLAVQHGRDAVALLPDEHPDLAIHLNNLTIALRHRFELTGRAADLNDALDAGRRSVERSAESAARALRLANLAATLRTSYELDGDLDDLDEAVRLDREAVDLVPAGDGERPGLLHNLAVALRQRSTALGSSADLQEAAVAMREAVDTSKRATETGWLREGYAQTLAALADRTGDTGYHRQAVAEFRAALAATGAGDAVLPFRLSNLATQLNELDDPAAAAEAADLARRAVAELPDEHYQAAVMRSALALALSRVAEPDLDEAVRTAADAAASAGDGPDRCALLVNLAVLLRRRGRERGADDDLTAAIAAFREAAATVTGPAALRLEAARDGARLAAERGDAARAADGMAAAVRLMPVLSPQRLERSDAHGLLADVAGLPEEAAALYLSSGSPERALEMLELGRGVLLHRMLRIRDDPRGLRDDPRGPEPLADELAERFAVLRDRISALDAEDGRARPLLPSGRMPEPGTVHRGLAMAHRHERRRELAEEFDGLVARIRAQRGMEHFLEPVPVGELLDEAGPGPVVLVNVGEERCDALVLTAGGLRTVPLPALRRDEVEETAFRFHREVLRAQLAEADEDRDAAEAELAGMLDWLWRTVAAPVLADLDRHGTFHARLWWVPTGSLALLPLHAAMSADGSDSVLDRTVSLYSPTVTALRHGRRRDAPVPPGRRDGRPLVLHCSAGNDRHPKLPWAEPEASRVAARYAVSPVDTAALSRDELLAAIGACTDLHASMHARSDPVDPARGALITGVDGDADSDSSTGTGVELTVTDIAARHNTAAGLAYLSACETTLGTPGLADEAVHLTGAFQLAGFQNVIGTYWAVRDAVADRASRWFYDALDRLGSPERAAHETALRLRGRYRGHPSAWAAHHCTGIGS